MCFFERLAQVEERRVPRRFWLGERPVAVAEILDRWISPEHRYFMVRGDTSAIYILRHDLHADLWELTLFETRSG